MVTPVAARNRFTETDPLTNGGSPHRPPGGMHARPPSASEPDTRLIPAPVLLGAVLLALGVVALVALRSGARILDKARQWG
ncbi:hypothetical protein K8O92_20340 [Nocardia asteroides]|nr:hypothetical protein K8O92_20340 [Nocardia asteroides]